MGKKKFSRDDDPDNSTDDEAPSSSLVVGSSIGSSSPSCPHVGKAVSIADLKKALKVSFVKIGKCSACERDKKPKILPEAKNAKGGPQAKKTVASIKKPPQLPPTTTSTLPKITVDPNVPTDIWLCLRCAGQSCSPKENAPAPADVSHAMQHFQTPRSDLHCVTLNVNTWALWCFECKSELYIDSYKKLHESVDHVKRIAFTKSVTSTTPSASAIKKDFSMLGSASLTSLKNVAGTTNSVLPRARGLNNLGNTCFFNSVMQCLSAAHSFVKFLDTHCQNGAPLNLPAVSVLSKVHSDDSGVGCSRDGSTQSDDPFPDPHPEIVQVDALSLQLAEAGPITLAVAAFFKEMHSVTATKSGPVNPGHLFGQICRRSPQFRGFQQQDAHELLRHLMDGLRTEEVRRQRTAILKNFGLTEKTDPKKVDDKIKRKVNALSKHSYYTIVDKIFGGHLVSTIVCEQCHNSSQIYEPFLDLSLPLIDQKPPRPGGNGSSYGKNSKTLSSNGFNDDADGNVSCFGRSKKKSGDDNEDEAEPVKSKHQLKKEKEKAKKEKRKNKNKNRHAGEKEATMEAKKDAVPDQPENPDSNQENPESKPGSDQPQIETDSNLSRVEEESENGVIEASLVKTELETNDDESKAEIISNETENSGKKNGLSKPVNTKKPANADSKRTTKSKSKKSTKRPASDEEEEDDGYSEEAEDDWEWDYGEQWNEGGAENNKEEIEDDKMDQDSDYLEVSDAMEDKPVETQIKQSLNPLPPEMLERGSSEREKSSEPIPLESDDDEEAETGASINGDVEDNLDETAKGSAQPEVAVHDEKIVDIYCPDSNHLDPHMESLCRRVRKLSVSASNVIQDSAANGLVDDDLGDVKNEANDDDVDEEAQTIRLRQEWIARSLTSIAPRYHSRAGECSIYSSLSQFTAPELLTGSNKWACDRCTKMAAEKLRVDDEKCSEDEDTDEVKSKEKKKPPTVYSNASKQLLIFSPPAVLTIHLKRFQQTMCGLRKDNRHVEFPFSLNLASFCATTSLSNANVDAGTQEICYDLFGVVEHSGRLQGGHYTASVKVRPALSSNFGARFHSDPTTKTDDLIFLIGEIQRKCRSTVPGNDFTSAADAENAPEVLPPSKWYHISDSSVVEVSEERVLKSQAYLLFYERVK